MPPSAQANPPNPGSLRNFEESARHPRPRMPQSASSAAFPTMNAALPTVNAAFAARVQHSEPNTLCPAFNHFVKKPLPGLVIEKDITPSNETKQIGSST